MASSFQASALDHQASTNVPRLDSAVVDPTSGEISKTWYYFLLKMWQLLGGNKAPPLQQGVFFSSSDGESNATAFSADTGTALLGGNQTELSFTTAPGSHSFTAPSSGTLVLSSNITFTISRNGFTPVQVSAAGGAIFLQQKDVVEGSWTASNAYFNFYPFIFK